MCFNNFGFGFGCCCHRRRRHCCNRFEESSSCDHRRRRRHRREESSDRNRNNFNIRASFNQNDFCRAVRECNRRNRNRRHESS